MKPINFASVLLFMACSAHAASLITMQFTGQMSNAERQTFTDAAAYWNSVITGYTLLYDSTGAVLAHGLTITASLSLPVGPGGVVGSAGPDTTTYYSNSNDPFVQPTVALYYATTGSMDFDSAEAAILVNNGTFYGFVLHEMAHVLGFGNLWTTNNNVNGTNSNLYTVGSGQYMGGNAVSQWKSEFGRPTDTFVPIELGGGPGTEDGHWNENENGIGNTGIVSLANGMDFASELMTGWASDTFFISRTTLGSIEDLGYTVDYSKAVAIPELSSLLLMLGSVPWLMSRRRPKC